MSRQLPVTTYPKQPLAPEIERDLLRAYIDSAQDGIFVLCGSMQFHVANPLLSDWLGIPEAELIAHGQRLPITQFLGKTLESEFPRLFQRALQGEAVRLDVEIQPPAGQRRWVEMSLNPVRLPQAELVIGIMRDITEQRRLYNTLQHYASHDDLTGLANRREFQQRLSALVESAHRSGAQHALIYIDLDQFKVVNDVCGHPAGDELLRQLGSCLQALSNQQHLIARLGGDEFGMLLQDVSIERAMQIADTVCSRVAAQPYSWQARRFEITASIGVCAITRATQSAEMVLSSADAACYVAKDKGRNRVQLYFGGKACAGKRAEMEWVSRLHAALQANHFQIWFQNLLTLNSPAGHYYEVLLRLVDQQDQVIAPGQFFPAAEHYGLMPGIDRWVLSHLLLGEGAAQLRQAMAQDSTLHCSINLSGASLNDDKFLVFLEQTLKASMLPAASICFEVTETVAIANLARVGEVMRALKQFGCQFALDDFGSGMSSFGYLKTLPVDFLKIDGALVRDIDSDSVNLTMVEAIHRIGRVLGIRTVAEFVETQAQLDCLRAIGVDYAQGYAIHRPELLTLAKLVR